jgi:prepilin-type N-terminal cleavage/methylation domain-containing protein
MALNRTRAACHLQAHHAFTMVELLVVIGIIGLLVGLSLVVGSQVMGGAKVRATEETLRVLDQALQEYINAEGDNPPPIYEVPGSNAVFPVADARDMTNAFTPPAGSGGLPGHQMLNSVGFFYAQASKVSAAKAVLDNLPARYVRMYDPDGTGTGDQPSLMTVFDAWGRPIRYVHPVWQGVIAGDITAASPTYTQPRSASQVLPLPAGKTYAVSEIRRNNRINPAGVNNAQDQPDGDGGMCVGNRPYFYSVGPDGLAGVRMMSPPTVEANYNADNVYVGVTPNFADK